MEEAVQFICAGAGGVQKGVPVHPGPGPGWFNAGVAGGANVQLEGEFAAGDAVARGLQVKTPWLAAATAPQPLDADFNQGTTSLLADILPLYVA
jgi:hypothetical protein